MIGKWDRCFRGDRMRGAGLVNTALLKRTPSKKECKARVPNGIQGHTVSKNSFVHIVI